MTHVQRRERQARPKVLLFDIETAGVSARHADLGFVLMVGYKWTHEPKACCLTIKQHDLARFNDRRLLIEASKLFEEADLIVGHFASIFDRRFINGRLLINHLPPLPATKIRDTCLIMRSVAKFSSYRLKHLAKVLKLRHQKLENDWPNAWFQVMRGNMAVLAELAEYCIGDVLALEDLYNALKAFDAAHPRIWIDPTRVVCGLCGGSVQYRGYAFTQARCYRRYQCLVCYHWGRDTKTLHTTQ